MTIDWDTELVLLRRSSHKEKRLRDLENQSLAQKHAYIFHVYKIHDKNDDLTMWILQTIALVYGEIDTRWPGFDNEIREQLQDHMNNNIGDAELLPERLAIMALLR